MEAKQYAVVEYLRGLHSGLGPDDPDHLGPLLSYVANLDENHNGALLTLYGKHEHGGKFAPTATIANAIRDYDGTDPEDFVRRLIVAG